jgi:membrane fusion protein, multidrug efflux system
MRKSTIMLSVAFALMSGLCRGGPAEGITQPRTEVRVSSPVQEIVAQVMVEEGAVVKQGDTLARLVDDIEKAELQRQEKVLEKRQFDYKAVANLAAEKIASQEKELEARVEMEMAAIDLDIARRKLEEKTIRAPVGGIVVRRYKEPGESVDRVEPMFELVNIDQLYLQFHLPLESAMALEPGREITFRQKASGSGEYVAKVEFVNPAADPASGLVRVRLLFNNPGHAVKAGARVQAEFP